MQWTSTQVCYLVVISFAFGVLLTAVFPSNTKGTTSTPPSTSLVGGIGGGGGGQQLKPPPLPTSILTTPKPEIISSPPTPQSMLCDSVMSAPRETSYWRWNPNTSTPAVFVRPGCNANAIHYNYYKALSCLSYKSVLFTGQSVLHGVMVEILALFGKKVKKTKSRFEFQTWQFPASATHLDYSFSYSYHKTTEEDIRSVQKKYDYVVIALGLWEITLTIQDPISMYENMRSIVKSYYDWFPDAVFIVMDVPYLHKPHYISSFRHLCITDSLQEKMRIIVQCAVKSVIPNALHFDSYAYTHGSFPASAVTKDGMHYPQHHPVRTESAQALLRGLCYHNATTIKNLPRDHPDRLECPSNWRDLVNYTCNIACRCDGVWADRSYCQEQKRTREQDRGVSMPTCYNNSATDDQILQDYKRWMADYYRKKKKP
eukprot:PhF_6_TR37875/c1_g1_i4/m.56490